MRSANRRDDGVARPQFRGDTLGRGPHVGEVGGVPVVVERRRHAYQVVVALDRVLTERERVRPHHAVHVVVEFGLPEVGALGPELFEFVRLGVDTVDGEPVVGEQRRRRQTHVAQAVDGDGCRTVSSADGAGCRTVSSVD